MIPTNSGRTSPCDPISSNCVIWQGPDIPCINLCQGDTISDVTAKIGEELCDLISGTCLCDPDMSSIDLSCIAVGSPGTIQEITQQIIDYLCALTPGSTGETICDYPECMWHLAPDGVTMIKSDTICSYVDYLSKRICELYNLHNILQQRVTVNEGNIAILMDNQVEPYVPPQLIPACTILEAAVGADTLVGLDILLHAVQVTLCNLMAALGTDSDMSYAMSSNLCALTGDYYVNQAPGGENNYGSLDRWINPVNNFSQSFNNMWVAFCDLRSAVQAIQINCCTIGCENITYDFNVSVVNPGTITGFIFTFTGADIPAPFHDCGAGSVITITDANGTPTSMPVDIFSLQSSLTGVTVPLDGLDPLSTYTCQVDFCFTDGTTQCEYVMIKDIPNDFTCPITVNTGPITDTTCPFNFTNLLGTSVTYNVKAIGVLTGVQQGGEVNFFPETPGTPTGEITGLSPETDYYLQITIINASSPTITTVCPFTLFTTLPTTCTTTMPIYGVDYVTDPVVGPGPVIGIFDCGGGPGFKRTWSMGSDPVTQEPIVKEFEEVGVGAATIINGTNLGVDTVDCGGVPYTLGAGRTAYLLPSTFTADNGVDYYIYGLWNSADPFGCGDSFLDGVVVCCVCPTILMDQHWNGEKGVTHTFTPVLPFGAVLSQAIPITPVNGSALSVGGGSFDYTHTGPGMTDSFGVTVTTICGASAVATMTVQITTSDPVLDEDADIYIFIDSGSVTSADAIDIHNGVLDFVAQMAADACTYNGSVYVLSLDHGNWLDYQKAIVDEGVSLTGLAAVAPYPNVWPVEWPAGTGPALNDKANVLLLAFCNESDGVGGYHDTNVLPDPYTTGPNFQPTGSFMLGFDEFMDGFYGDSDLIAHPPATVTAWGTPILGAGWAGFDKFRAILFSETLAGLGATKASNIMQLEAMEMRKIPDNEFIGYQMTDPANVAMYTTPAYGPVIPYVGVTTPPVAPATQGNLLEGLKTRGWLISMNQLGPAFDWGANMEAMAKDAAIGDDTCPDVP